MNFQQGYRPPQPPKPPKKRRVFPIVLAIMLVALAIGAGTFGYMAIRRAQEEKARLQALSDAVSPYNETFLPGIYVDGISLGGMTAQQGIDAVLAQIKDRQTGWNLGLTYRGHLFYTLHYSDFGVSTDVGSVYALLEPLYRKGKLGTLEERKAEMDAVAQEPIHAYTTESEMTDDRLDSILSQIQAELTTAPQDAYLAYFDPDAADPFVIQPEQYGSALDVAAVKEEILERAAEGKSGTLEFQPASVAPGVTTQDIRNQVTLRSKATTPISSASTEDRNSNIRNAFSFLNGKTVAPGERLSFNKVTKERTLKNGYKYAIEYVLGMEELGIGGGVCQASTTMYLAALLSDLQIVSRISHSDPVSYTTFGQDATVVYGRHDLVFKNNLNGTIYITAKVVEKKKNSLECQVCIYGPKLEDGVSYTLRTDTVETIAAPLTETYQKDTSHTYVTYKDEEPYQVRQARDGFVNETYLLKWKDGELIEEKFVSRDTCKARGAVYAVGTLNRED
ncbi:MAG: VanW family protein [Clostridia bacterium]|nr:VanW family protein [Clostridia bacterium]